MERFLFFFSSVLTAVTNFRGRGRTPEPGNVLIIKLDHLGDVLTVLPAVRQIRLVSPDSRLTLLCGTWVKDLAEELADIDEIIYYNGPRFCREPAFRMTASQVASIKRQIFSRRYDMVVHLRGDCRTAWWSFRLRPRVMIDRGLFRWKLRLKLWKGKSDKRMLSELQTNLEMIAEFLPCIATEIQAGPYLLEWYGELPVQELNEVPYVVVHPGATWSYRQWSPDKFARLIDGLGQNTKLPIVMTGIPRDRSYAASIQAQTDYPVYNYVGKLNFHQWCRLLRMAALCIATEGAAIHLASLLDRPVLGLFGPESPEKWGPWSGHSRSFHVPVSCFPCPQRICVVPENPCVNLISEEAVMQVAMQILYETAAQKPGVE